MAYLLKHREKGACLKCGAAIYGRPDKKFCSLACKNAYHNNEVSKHRKVRTETVKALSKNYEILDKLEKNKIRTIGIDRIRELGFDENYSTGHSIGRFSHNVEHCFDISYCRTQAKIFHIRRKP